ncbi:MAG TPA: hypothetical protein DCY20_00030 [Firmicutes bacterium]|nr:hypothetical protein [Bacillota bacterium]
MKFKFKCLLAVGLVCFMSVMSVSAKEVEYEKIVQQYAKGQTVKISMEQLLEVKAGMTYEEVVKLLGATRDIGSGRHVLQYVVDDNKILYLGFGDYKEKCLRSGADLAKSLVTVDKSDEDELTFNASLIYKGEDRILVSSPTHPMFDVIDLLVSDETEIVYEDGQEASFEDISGKLLISIKPMVTKSIPPQGAAVKIVILSK